MGYYPGHSYFVRYAPSTSVISATTGLITGTTAIGSALDLGYTQPGSIVINDNARKGYASGRRSASYSAKGWREVTATIPIRIGMGEFLATYCLPAGDLPEIELYYGVSASWARVIHKAKCSRVSVNVPLNEGSEITATATFEGQAYSNTTPVTIGFDYEEFGPALLASDVRTLTVTDAPTDILANAMALSFDVDWQLERKPGRPEFGNDVPGSRTSRDIIQHHQAITGSLTLHDMPTIESGLFYGAALKQNWGDLVALISDVADTKEFDFTLSACEPVSRSQNEVESSGQMNWTIPFVADAATVAATDLVGG